MKRSISISGSIFVALALSAVIAFVGWSLGWSVGRGNPVGVTVAATVHTPPHYYLTIATPDQLGGTEETGPAYVPSNFSLPANTDVTVTITNFDDPDGLTGHYAVDRGVKGPVTYETIPDQANPNAPGTTSTTFDPKNISHTFSIDKIGLNVAVTGHSKVTFTFHTPVAGTYNWRCYVPCGNGPVGWGGPMVTNGYMQGQVTVV